MESGTARQPGNVVLPRVELLGSDGHWTSGVLESLDAQGWRIRAGAGDSNVSNVVVVPAASVAACLVLPPAGERAATAGPRLPDAPLVPLSLGVLETRDGQRLPGSLRVERGATTWDHRWIGAIPLDLERLAWLRLLGEVAPPVRPDADVVRLANGDLVTGFVDSIGADVVVEPLDEKPVDAAGAAPRRIPLERVAAIGFAAVGAPPAVGTVAWTVDGSIVGTRALAFDAERGWGFTLVDPWLASVRAARTSDNSAADPVAIVTEPSRFLPLAACRVASVERIEGEFRASLGSAVHAGDRFSGLLGLASLAIEGGVVARFAPPDGVALRASLGGEIVFTADLVLAESTPADAAVDVEVALGADPPQRVRLDRDRRRAACVLRAPAVAGTEIAIRVGDAGNGPVGDRILVERGVLLLPPT